MFSTCEHLIVVFSECFLRVNVLVLCLVSVFYVLMSYFCVLVSVFYVLVMCLISVFYVLMYYFCV